MAKRIPKEDLKHDEFVEAAFDFGRWLEEHWAKVALSVGTAVFAPKCCCPHPLHLLLRARARNNGPVTR